MLRSSRAQHSTLLALPQQSFEMRQFGVGVDAQDLLGISHSDMRHTALLGHCESHDIREILFPLGILASVCALEPRRTSFAALTDVPEP